GGYVDAFSMHADSSASGDEDVPIVEGIGEVGQAVIGAARGGVEVGGAFHVGRFMWPFLIEFLHEIIESGLLLETVHSRRPGRLFLERKMHALMAAVLLGMTGLDALDGDAEPEPPDGELREVEERVGAGEGNAVVGADGERQAAFAKEAVERGDGEVFAR